jgi:predicted Fe-Mo cluster-binding NifX family protein
MKIALVTDDHQTISAHFGRAQFYEIFTLEAGQVTNRETIARSFPQMLTVGAGHEPEGEHPHQHDHNAMITPIADCQALLTRGMGRGAHLSLQEHDIQPIITDIHEIQAAVEAYLAGTIVDHPERLH